MTSPFGVVRRWLSHLGLRRRVKLFKNLSKRDLLRGRRAIRVNAAVLEIPPDRAWAYSDGTYWEADVLPFLLRAASATREPVFYDIGANCGHYAVALASNARSIFAFEPIAETFAVLERNIRRNKLDNVTPFRLALGEAAGEATFYVYSSSGLNSAIRTGFPQREERVAVDTIDELLAAGRILPADLIKIDTEGSELSILKGAGGLLDRSAPIVVLEYHAAQARAAGYELDDVRREFSNRSYSLSRLADYPAPLTKEDGAADVTLVALPSGKTV